ncbi:S1 family peptidase [Streptomyces gamaensis]|uniref:S1 family peptidase n=1 Tax=Streptomyces gamaensis TaxID=1763542 RepID=A0ABW0Z7A8_9ACTN
MALPTSASAVVGNAATDGTYTFTAKIDIGGLRSCSGALVDKQWILTAGSCFVDVPTANPHPPAGAPKLKSTATIGRTDLNGGTGSVVGIVELVPHPDRDLVMARLAKPVSGITPVALAKAPPATGESLQVAGYGRTKDTWVPTRLHTGSMAVTAVHDGTVELAGQGPEKTAICRGDTGGPAIRVTDGRTELVAVHSTSWQNGCLGSDAPQDGATDTRADDLGPWVQKIAYAPVFAAQPWKQARLSTAGYFTGGSPGTSRHMDLIVKWSDGEVTLYQGAEGNDPRYPFAAEHRLAPAKGLWTHAVSLSAGRFTGSGPDGLIVRWDDAELTQYTHVSPDGFTGEKRLAPARNATWPKAHQLTVGNFTGSTLRDDLLVVWDNGRVTLFPDTDANGLRGEEQVIKANTTWPYADRIAAGHFTGKPTDDLLVRWYDGEMTIYSGSTSAGIGTEHNVRPAKSVWRYADILTPGAFTANQVPNDLFVKWEGGAVSLYDGVDTAGLHAETKLFVP